VGPKSGYRNGMGMWLGGLAAFGPTYGPGNCAPGAGDVGTVFACEAENLS
jgi:hypothetical protein